MKAFIVPYSSTVGSSVAIQDDDGYNIAVLPLTNVIIPEGSTHKIESEKIAQYVSQAINEKKRN